MPNFEVVVIPAPAWAAAIQFLPTGPITADNVQDALEQAVLISGGDSRYVHTQSTPSTVWTITHGLGKRPAALAVDNGGTRLFGDEEYPDEDTMTISFSTPESGIASLN